MKSRSLFYLSIAGFIATLTIHLLALVFQYDVATHYNSVYNTVLICSFIVFGLPLLVLGLKGDLRPRGGFNIMLFPITFLQIIYKNAPTWLIALNIACLGYMLLNDTISPNVFTYSVDVDNNNQYVYHNYYTADDNPSTSIILQEEYLKYRAGITRYHTGGILLFYCIGMAMVYPFEKKRTKLSNSSTHIPAKEPSV